MPEHGQLAALLPREAMVKKSVVFSDWDQVAAQPAGNGSKAVLPTVQAMYDSVGYRVVVDDPKAPKGKKRAEIDHPQQATLILVRTPEAAAAATVADRLRKHFTDKGFSTEASMRVGDGSKLGGRIERFLRIDTGAEADSVYVAYLQVIGNLVVYAVETEKPPPIKAADGTQAKRVLSGPSGARLGAQLVLLVLTRAVQ
jgi:hypothetical protein